MTLNELQARIGPCTNSLWIKGQMAQMFKQAFRVPGFLFPKPKLWLVIRGNKGTPRDPHSSQGYRWRKRVVEQVWLQTFQSYVPWCLSKKHKKDFFASHEFKKCFKNDDFWVKKTLKIWLVRAHVSIEDSCSCQSQERKKGEEEEGQNFWCNYQVKKLIAGMSREVTIICQRSIFGGKIISKISFQFFWGISLTRWFRFFCWRTSDISKCLNFTINYTELLNNSLP